MYRDNNQVIRETGETLQDPVRAIKAVGDRTRLQILKVLLQVEHCVTDIARSLGLAQPRTSGKECVRHGNPKVQYQETRQSLLSPLGPLRFTSGSFNTSSINLSLSFVILSMLSCLF